MTAQGVNEILNRLRQNQNLIWETFGEGDWRFTCLYDASAKEAIPYATAQIMCERAAEDWRKLGLNAQFTRFHKDEGNQFRLDLHE